MFLTLLATSHLTALRNDNIDRPDEILAYLKPLLPDSRVTLEAGGNEGEDTLRMKSVWPQATMYVFEPQPSSYEKLVDNTRHLFLWADPMQDFYACNEFQ